MSDIAHELRVRPLFDIGKLEPCILISPQERDEAVAEIERLQAIVTDACEVLRHYDLPEHAFHYERVLRGEVPLTVGEAVAAQDGDGT